jgi:SAM-dependent methyltransferase
MNDTNQKSTIAGNSETLRPTARFTDRVEDYVKARPGYPPDIIGLLEQRCGLTPRSTIVDVGCGTGLLANLFCKYGCSVVGVEPNAAMRMAGQQFLAGYKHFEMLDGTAESIPILNGVADFVTAGQAFHWFNPDSARREFKRVLTPNGWVVLVWNYREFKGSKFAEDYEALVLRFGVDYAEVHQRWTISDAGLERFFGHLRFCRESFLNIQRLDYETLMARIQSSSYMPRPDNPNYSPMFREAECIFRDHQQDGFVLMKYNTRVIYGQLENDMH